MGLFRSLGGVVRVEYTSADISAVLEALEKRDITVYDLDIVDDLILVFTVSKNDLVLLNALAERRGEKVKVIRRIGLFWVLRFALRRKLLICGLVFLLIVASVLPGRIFFIDVEGNERIPAKQILEAAAESGLSFGSTGRNIRSEQIKNRLLDALPELKWAGVNTYGSRAVISVRERDDTREETQAYTVRHIAAARDGIVLSATVTDGSGVCTVGQAVKAGDILISGYTDCGLTIRATAAKGQIIASTERKLEVYTPATWALRTEKGTTRVRYSVTVGKKRINFYKGSGISGTGCVKMYSEYVLRLPGGFNLPVSLRKECVTDYDVTHTDVPESEVWLKAFAEKYLHSQMVSGTVTKTAESLREAAGCRILEGKYACIEDIGICRDEKIGELHGKADGTDRERGSGG